MSDSHADHDATTELGDKIQEMIGSDRIVDPLCVFVTSEYGWSANVERIMKSKAFRDNSMNSKTMSKKTLGVNPAHSTTTELKEARRTSLARHEGFDEAEIVKVAQTIPQERIPNPVLEQVVVLDVRNVEDPASREHSRGGDAQNPQEDVGRRES